eukprot:XP_008666548.1 uncharacterized protein LOC103645237 [Zea mays]
MATRSSARIASKPKSNLTMEEQTTALLMKRSGTIPDHAKPNEQDHARFRAQFVDHLNVEAAAGYQSLFILVDSAVVSETLGPDFFQNFAFLPADSTRGGILLAVHASYFRILSTACTSNIISALIQSNCVPSEWWITVVYGPQLDAHKLEFLHELRQLGSISTEKWLIIGDFNLIISAEDKSNNNLNKRLMGAFRSVLNDLELKELPLRGRRFTWTNSRTHTRIDRAFCSNDWDLMFPSCSVQALSSLVSDHCPLFLSGDTLRRPYKGFCFESFWPKLSGYSNVVENAWNRQLTIFNPFLRLHTKLQRTAKALRKWSKALIGNNKLLMLAAKQLIWIFDVEDKAQLAFNHYSNLLGTSPVRANSLNWEFLGLQAADLSHLEAPFDEEEVLAAINDLHAEKAPGPDDFIGVFFRSAWAIVKEDLLLAVNYFYHMHDQHFNKLNSTHICLIPKNSEAALISDFRPISLTHSIAKIISKVLANRLAPCLDQLVSRSQSAFIRKRSIHDNFLFTQNLIKELNRAKIPTLFLKLDIAKAFDSVRWDYLLEVLHHLGFGNRWKAWVSILLRSASSAVMINGVRGNFFNHGRGLRQGDPLSPLLFILAIDPVQRLFDIASREGLLSPILHRSARLRVSLYADDVAIFINPIREEVQITNQILAAFSEASGLSVNLSKCVVYPIRCDSLQLEHIMQPFPCAIKAFPCKYLGLPLTCRPLRRVDFQPLFDKLAGKLSAWKGKLLDKAGRLTLAVGWFSDTL